MRAMILDVLSLGPYPWLCLFVGAVLYFQKTYRNRRRAKYNTTSSPSKAQEDNPDHVYTRIEPLPNFHLSTTEPIKLHPFKPKYHLTMALENMPLSHLLEFDNTYASRIALRRRLISERPHDVLAANPVIAPAIHEFWTWMSSVYLPRRFPTLFTLSPGGGGGGGGATPLTNHLTSETLPTTAASTAEALRLLGSHIDTDFLFLLPRTGPAVPAEDQGKYYLEGFITCFPSGFSTPRKLGLKLADVHAPVPSYRAKLEKSMDRFFAALPVGKAVKRVNWSVTTNRQLFALAGNHISAEDATGGGEDGAEVDLRETVLRVERQTLHRLPRSKAIVFAFKTYQYELEEVKGEGLGEELASAIEGLEGGSVPGMAVYKRGVVWGERVKGFLRG